MAFFMPLSKLMPPGPCSASSISPPMICIRAGQDAQGGKQERGQDGPFGMGGPRWPGASDT